MCFVDSRGFRIRYRFDGPADGPVIVLSNSLGTDLSMWEPQMRALTREFRVLRYDTRGQGLSTTAQRPCTIEELGRDVLALLDILGVRRAHFCGLSMGGMIGLWLGIYAAERVEKLALCNTAARIGAADVWNSRITMVRENGMGAVASASIQRWFTAAYIRDFPDSVESARQMLLHSPPQGYIACCEAIRDANLVGDVARVKADTLVISGSYDPSTPPADGRFLARNIPDGRYVELNASHLSNIEAAKQFSDALLKFLNEPPAGR